VPLLDPAQHILGYTNHPLASAIAGALVVPIDANAGFTFKHASCCPAGKTTQLGCLIDGSLMDGGDLVKQAWEWNQIHKKGKLRLFSLAELARALRSASDRSLLAQIQAHEGCDLCMDECYVCHSLLPVGVSYSVGGKTYCDACCPHHYRNEALS
jgi:hypothetical protein